MWDSRHTDDSILRSVRVNRDDCEVRLVGTAAIAVKILRVASCLVSGRVRVSSVLYAVDAAVSIAALERVCVVAVCVGGGDGVVRVGVDLH